jgi:hypothetical protein
MFLPPLKQQTAKAKKKKPTPHGPNKNAFPCRRPDKNNRQPSGKLYKPKKAPIK